MTGFLGFLRNLGPAKLAAIGATILALVIFFSFLISRFSAPQLSLLFADLDPKDSGTIITKLDAMEIPYKLKANGSQILVPDNQVDKLRLTLAKDGIPHGGSIGYEIFDKNEGFGASQFIQNLNHVRALEGELARTISSISSVKSARVHLVFGKKELFARDAQPPSASVVLSMRSSDRLTRSEIAAIQHLVASAVPGLKPTQISIIDDRGTLLAKGFHDENSPESALSNSEEMRSQFEQRMRSSLEDMLERILGVGNVRVEVSADLDFNRIVSSEEIYDPDSKVARSTQTNEESSEGSEKEENSNVSAQNNTPNAQQGAAGGTQSKNSTKRTEETINYEISKTIKNTTKEIGAIKRLSVAVLVDGIYSKGANAQEESYQPRSEDELKQITTLVKSAIGFDDKRNDSVQVTNMKFQKLSPQATLDDDKIMGMSKKELLRIAENLGFALVGLLALLLIVRPILIRAFEGPSVRSGGPLSIETEPAFQTSLGPPPTKALEKQTENQSDEEDLERMVNLEQVAGKVKASSIGRVTRIIESHPDEAISVIRSWLHQDSSDR